MSPTTKFDQEVTELLTKLYEMQESCGAKQKTTKEEKRNRAVHISMGKTKKAKKTGSKFLEVKGTIIDRLMSIQELMKDDSDRTNGLLSVVGGISPNDVIARQSKIRQEISQASVEWKELDEIYKNELRKRNSKFSAEDLEFQQTIVQKLHSQIDNIKEVQISGYARVDGLDDVAMAHNKAALTAFDHVDFDDSGTFKRSPSRSKWGDSSVGIEMTEVQHQKLDFIKDRDVEFDKQLNDIGEGLHDLIEIAQMQSEEVHKQKGLIENLEGKMDKTSEHITNVNVRMKETLTEVRGADKICVDIMCIVLMLGLGFVMYKQLA